MSRPEGTGWPSQRTTPTKAERKLAARQATFDKRVTPIPGTKRPGSLNRRNNT